ncbi:hypothetical protein [Streptomyces hyaluromycini]|uniref:hypothetical protein n=1 Tax=Streptomyces hyaluromycini TaxID=1377993 RepID=UPI000B5C570E|nr:hypothetical protein [Streptomyces hyaluromycini]
MFDFLSRRPSILFRRPSLRITAALLTATAIVGTGVGLRTSGALPELAGRHSSATKIGSVADAVVCAPGTGTVVNPGTGTVGLGGTGTSDCSQGSGSSAGAPIGGDTVRSCWLATSGEDAFKEFMKGWISNNSQRWAGELQNSGVDPATATPSSPRVDKAFTQMEQSFYDSSSAFAQALASVAQNDNEHVSNCTASDDGPEPNWMDEAFGQAVDLQNETPWWLEQAEQALVQAVAQTACDNAGGSC